LYAVGTEQVKGFAVTLVLGIALNLFTAIFCARVIMDVLASQRWIKTFNMMQLFKRPSINFLGARWVCAVFSLALIAVGLAAVFQRGRGLLDIDFVGGVSVEVVFKNSQDISQIRKMVTEKDATIKEEENKLNDVSVQNIQVDLDEEGNPLPKEMKDTRFIITSSIPQVKSMEEDPSLYLKVVENLLKDTFKDQLVYWKLDTKIVSSEKIADNEEMEKTVVSISRSPKTNKESLDKEIEKVIQNAKDAKLIDERFAKPDITPQGSDDKAFVEDWTLTFNAPKSELEAVLKFWSDEVNGKPHFPTSNIVGGSVAQDTRIQGLMALIAGLIFMAIYITVRFHRWVYGVIAVVGLLHVVLIMLGLLALSKWCTSPLLLINEFKIGLPVVAAFLTIIGYAINDTIILFDRIRENLGKATVLTGSMINLAINQTLSRTVLTSATTFFVAFILYVFGGSGIHTFAFAISVGVFFGTYSTIGICASLLFWSIGKDDLKPQETMAIEKMEK
jgi:SecD/SecF fusion protein